MNTYKVTGSSELYNLNDFAVCCHKCKKDHSYEWITFLATRDILNNIIKLRVLCKEDPSEVIEVEFYEENL